MDCISWPMFPDVSSIISVPNICHWMIRLPNLHYWMIRCNLHQRLTNLGRACSKNLPWRGEIFPWRRMGIPLRQMSIAMRGSIAIASVTCWVSGSTFLHKYCDERCAMVDDASSAIRGFSRTMWSGIAGSSSCISLKAFCSLISLSSTVKPNTMRGKLVFWYSASITLSFFFTTIVEWFLLLNWSICHVKGFGRFVALW